MSAKAAAHVEKPAAAKPAASPSRGILQRQCACGQHASGGGECETCRKKQQTESLRRVPDSYSTTGQAVPPIVNDVLRLPGQPLNSAAQAEMQPHFGHDFSEVRVHTSAKAAESARAVGALAYTVGTNIVFGAGQYAPETGTGRALLAHELAHVFQQGAIAGQTDSLVIGSPTDPAEQEADQVSRWISAASGRAPGEISPSQPLTRARPQAPTRLRRAVINAWNQRVEVNYGNVASVLVGDYISSIETLFTGFTGSPATLIHASVSGLTVMQQYWLLFAMDLLIDNTARLSITLDRVGAVRQLIDYAPRAVHQPSDRLGEFESEVLRASGWSEAMLTQRLSAPTGATRARIQTELNPPPGVSAPLGGVLDRARLDADLPPALTALLNANDPASWPSTGTQSMAALRSVADVILEDARTLFAPYIDASPKSPLAGGWTYSTRLDSTTAIIPTRDQRLGYLLNRAEIVGREDRIGGSIFSNTNFDSSRASDQAALLAIVTTLEADPAIQATVNRLIQQTGRTNSLTRRVAVTPDYNADRFTECGARWRTIRTLSHELVHALVHPDFPAQATSVGFGQVIREGFTEVLGVELYDHLVARANSSLSLRNRLQAGIATSCPPPPATSIGYGEAGPTAERVRLLVGNANFRAAYFLGAVHLIGL